jgi:uncharacterized membrane protein HdeD (DUF308 family)
MDWRGIGWTALGVLGVLIGFAYFFWPTNVLAINDRLSVGLLFVIPGVISFYHAKLAFAGDST